MSGPVEGVGQGEDFHTLPVSRRLERLSDICRMVISDMHDDVAKWDGQIADGRTIATMHGELAGTLAGLANALDALITIYHDRETPPRTRPINIVFDGPPSHESGRFVEVETDDGAGLKIGEWLERPDGLWALRITELPTYRVLENLSIYEVSLTHDGPGRILSVDGVPLPEPGGQD